MKKKATREQIERSIKKLARAAGRWNVIGGDRRKLEGDLFMCAWLLFMKAGYRKEYEKGLEEARFKRAKNAG